MSKVVAIIQDRDHSTRLPGKSLLPLPNGKNVLQTMIDRVKESVFVNEIVVATPHSSEKINQYCLYNTINQFKGLENDVIGRMHECAKAFGADIIVELTADCPLVDPGIIDHIGYQLEDLDYISNTMSRSFPDGFDVQIYPISTLKILNEKVQDKEYRTHPGWNVWQEHMSEEHFSCRNIYAEAIYSWPELGLTLDEAPDYVLLWKIVEHFTKGYSPIMIPNYKSIVQLVRTNNWQTVNESVKRKIPGTDEYAV